MVALDMQQSQQQTPTIRPMIDFDKTTPTYAPAFSTIRQRLLLSILAGFTGYYFCRTNLVVSMNSILKSLPGVDKGQLGTVLSFGYLFYAIGKLVNGALIDLYGGSTMFLTGLAGTISCTLLFTAIPASASVDVNYSLFLMGCVWSLNRFFQSAGWGSLVKVLSGTFPTSMHGRVLGIATVSDTFIDVTFITCLVELWSR